MNRTKIEWVKNPDGTQGYTWNPITGCLNHKDGICKGGNFPCYAYRLANGRLKERYLTNENVAENEVMTYPRHIECIADPFYPRFWPERLGEPHSLGGGMFGQATIPKGIFVCDMSDLCGIGIPEDWTKQVMAVIEACPQHRFYLLTKQPQNLIKFSPFPDNCCVGVTATDDDMFNDACYYLDRIVGKIKYISVEPLLKYVSEQVLNYWLQRKKMVLNQIIIGAQTKPYKPPKIEWVEEIVRACDKAGIPVFLKDNLKPLLDTLDITGTNFGRLTSLAVKDTKGLARQRSWYKLRQEVPSGRSR